MAAFKNAALNDLSRCYHNRLVFSQCFQSALFLTRLFGLPLIKGTCHMFRQGSRVCFYSHMDASMKRWPFCVQGSYVVLIRQCQGQAKCVREEIRCNHILLTEGKLDLKAVVSMLNNINNVPQQQFQLLLLLESTKY